MIDVRPADFGVVSHLSQAGVGCFPLIAAVVEGSQAGHVFVDDAVRPRSALVITRFGFTQWLGSQNSHDLLQDVERLLVAGNSSGLPAYWLWYDPPEEWQRRLVALAPDRVRRRERQRFHYPSQSAKPQETGQSLSAFDLRPLDAAMASEVVRLGLVPLTRFWDSEEDFLAHGIGVCALRRGEIASVCYSACVTNGLAEVDIATLPQYRGMGLASAVGRAFIEQCLRQNVVPTWDCFVANAPSMRLAGHLGFVPLATYPLYSFNIPLTPPRALPA